MDGIFVTFDGPEGCGKSTQAKLLADLLSSMEYTVTLTQDPGGTFIGDKVREVLLDPTHSKMTPMAELFLFLASRRQLVDETIKPALSKGNIVICSRYTDATLAYQGYGRGLDLALLKELNDVATDNIYPELTILLDINPEIGLMRVKDRSAKESGLVFGEMDRIEEERIAFHNKVREGYLDLCKNEPERIKKLDADDTLENVQAEVKGLVIDVLEKI